MPGCFPQSAHLGQTLPLRPTNIALRLAVSLGSQAARCQPTRIPLPLVMPDAVAANSVTVAITGGSACGKSTLTEAMADYFGDECAVLDHDSYYLDQSHLSPDERTKVNYDDPASLDNALLIAQLQQLRRGESIDKPCYCFATHSRLPEVEQITPKSVVIVEGILVLSLPELHDVFDLRVFVDTPADVRALRRVRRDVRERGRTIETVFDQWFATVQPMHARYIEPVRETADVVVSGMDPTGETASHVQRAIEARL